MRDRGLKLRVARSFSEQAEELARLWFNTYERAGEYKREILKADFFKNIDSYMQGRSCVILAESEADIVGFLLCLLDDTTMIPLFCGLDYKRCENSAVYFNLFYCAIELAIEREMLDIDFEVTTLAPKIDLGATVTTLHMYMKHLNPIGNQLVPRFFKFLTPDYSRLSRNVFKNGNHRVNKFSKVVDAKA